MHHMAEEAPLDQWSAFLRAATVNHHPSSHEIQCTKPESCNRGYVIPNCILPYQLPDGPDQPVFQVTSTNPDSVAYLVSNRGSSKRAGNRVFFFPKLLILNA